ncbi:MAG: 4Fe-4S binding protein [Candidatus Adiutrix sp.]|jgi:Fe-S-cluster-containing hydrogenase component 2|nr:4Fe-4S binding protein [Candidatus Adiutrix sp.]
MTPADPSGRSLATGPYLRPGGLAGDNLRLLALMGPGLLCSLHLRGSASVWAWPLGLAGALLGLLAITRERRRAVCRLDWAVAATLLAPALEFSGLPEPRLLAAELIGGLGCGLLISRPGCGSRLWSRPGPPPLLVWLAAFIAAGLTLEIWPLEGQVTWAELGAWATAGLGFAAGWRSGWPLALPGLAALALHLACPGPAWGWLASLPPPLFFIFIWPRSDRLGNSLGWPAEPAAPALSADRAWLRCGHQGRAPVLAEWLGLPSCRLNALNDDGHLVCPYGCSGLGDCVRACPRGAISLEQGFPQLDQSRCLGCGRCRAACPKGLLILAQGKVRAFIPCASRSSLKKSAAYCPGSCLGCRRCRKACPAQAITRDESGVLTVNQALCQGYGDCGRPCAAACPRRIIQPQSI